MPKAEPKLLPGLRVPPGLALEPESQEFGAMVLSFPLTPRSLVTGLTQAECAVVKGLLLGRSNAEIAASRAVAPSTVKNQVAAIFQKLGVHSRLELAIALGCSLAAPNAEACADGSTL